MSIIDCIDSMFSCRTFIKSNECEKHICMILTSPCCTVDTFYLVIWYVLFCIECLSLCENVEKEIL